MPNDGFMVIAGPCAVESREQIIRIAKKLKELGVNCLRGGAFKPRTNPNTFQGLKDEGIMYLLDAKEETGLPIVTELLSIEQIEKFGEEVDMIQVGSRNMYNYELLKKLGKLDKPILLKRGFSATYEEWINAGEYIRKGGNNKVILCERGIRGFGNETRNVLDLQAIPYIQKNTDYPVIVDPSHAAGNCYMIDSMCLAATAAGSNGIIVEVHDRPKEALCDKDQAVTPEEFGRTLEKVKTLRKTLYR